MDLRIALEWDEKCGLSLANMYPFREPIEEHFRNKEYGKSISSLLIILVARGYDFKQRKRFKKEERRFAYDILLDYFLIKNVEMAERKRIVRRQVIEISKETFSKYKFEDFDKNSFLSDLENIVNTTEW